MIDRDKVKAELDAIVDECRVFNYVRFAVVVEHCTNILTLLKEQEPKQVLSVADSVGEMEVGYCPSCRRGITNKTSDPTKFCRYCRQAVKWE